MLPYYYRLQIMPLTDPSTRIALAAFLHDVGKLAERASELDYRAVRTWTAGRMVFVEPPIALALQGIFS